MSGNVPKYIRLKKEILSWIESGKLKPHDRLPSENELADQFAISRQTVRQAIGDMVNDGQLYRVHGKGTFLASGKSVSRDGDRTIGVLTTYISNYIFPLIVRGAEAEVRRRGYRLTLSSTDNDREKERESLEVLLRQPLSGLIVEPTRSAEGNPNIRYFRSLEQRGVPFVMINERYPELDCPCLKVDDEAGGFMATAHLIEYGHRDIAGFFKTDDRQGVERMQGFIRAHREYGVPLAKERIVQFATEEKGDRPMKEAERMLQKPAGRPTAFVCYNDELAVSLLDVLRWEGLSVPDDISITGFDDSTLATATEVKLTTLSHPKTEMGRMAAELVIDLAERTNGAGGQAGHHRTHVFAPELIVRQSTRRLPR